MNALEYLTHQSSSYMFTVHKAFDGDYELRPGLAFVSGPSVPSVPSAADLIQLHCCLENNGYKLYYDKDNSIHVHAPHRKEHAWDDRGWECDISNSVYGCEVLRQGGI